MPRKKKEISDSSSTGLDSNPIEKYMEEVVNKVLDKRDEKLKKEDAQEIIKAILPEIELMISNVILEHFKAISLYALTKLKDPKEN